MSSKKTRQLWTVHKTETNPTAIKLSPSFLASPIPYSCTNIVIPHTMFRNELSTLNSKTGSRCQCLRKLFTEEMEHRNFVKTVV